MQLRRHLAAWGAKINVECLLMSKEWLLSCFLEQLCNYVDMGGKWIDISRFMAKYSQKQANYMHIRRHNYSK